MKTCTNCGIDKDLSDFHRSGKAKDGPQNQCRDCRNAKASVYAKNNKEKYYEHRKRWIAANPEREKENKRLRRLRNKGTDKEEKRKIYTQEERREIYLKRRQNPEWVENNKKKKAQFEREKRKNLYKRLESQIRCRTAIAMKGGPKLGKYEQYIGCSTEHLKKHLENQFRPGMTWGNWGRGGWHVDHILPVSSFDLSDPTQFFKAFHYSNLQPLWEKENLSKGSKILTSRMDKDSNDV
jgi:hypothetical protein